MPGAVESAVVIAKVRATAVAVATVAEMRCLVVAAKMAVLIATAKAQMVVLTAVAARGVQGGVAGRAQAALLLQCGLSASREFLRCATSWH